MKTSFMIGLLVLALAENAHTLASPDGTSRLTLHHTAEAGLTYALAADGAWLVGAATNEDPRTLEVPLDFLGEGTFEALVMQDGPGSDYRTHVESTTAERRMVASTDRVRLKLAPGGGGCILLRQSVP
jgi:hypothetical protein